MGVADLGAAGQAGMRGNVCGVCMHVCVRAGVRVQGGMAGQPGKERKE